ncbi:MAG: thioredoxin family protein [Candidatus Bathyarchaeia archaeon]
MSSNSVVDVSAETWKGEVLESDIPVVVDFWHHQCGWCRALNPIYGELSSEYMGRLKFARLNVLESHENQHIAMQYGVMGTPTLKFFCESRTVGEIVGHRPKNLLKEEINKILHQRKECLEKSTAL